jgi:hypothetical protein
LLIACLSTNNTLQLEIMDGSNDFFSRKSLLTADHI